MEFQFGTELFLITNQFFIECFPFLLQREATELKKTF